MHTILNNTMKKKDYEYTHNLIVNINTENGKVCMVYLNMLKPFKSF